jgi:hypothetical protein
MQANQHPSTPTRCSSRAAPEGVYPLAYTRTTTLAFASTMAGRSAQAITRAKKTAETTPAEVAGRCRSSAFLITNG